MCVSLLEALTSGSTFNTLRIAKRFSCVFVCVSPLLLLSPSPRCVGPPPKECPLCFPAFPWVMHAPILNRGALQPPFLSDDLRAVLVSSPPASSQTRRHHVKMTSRLRLALNMCGNRVRMQVLRRCESGSRARLRHPTHSFFPTHMLVRPKLLQALQLALSHDCPQHLLL